MHASGVNPERVAERVAVEVVVAVSLRAKQRRVEPAENTAGKRRSALQLDARADVDAHAELDADNTSEINNDWGRSQA